jgi:hypothetical protein
MAKLVPQVVLTLNLLRQSHVAPNILAYAYHHGTFDYNRMPLAPMGCAVQFHIKPNRRKTRGEHSGDGWYLMTSMDHIRCHYIFAKATRAKRISDTVYFKHKHITQPSLTTEDLVIKAIQDLSNAFKGGKNLGDNTQIEAITRLTNALRPGNELPLQERSPRVQVDAPPRVQIDAPPRLQFDLLPPRLIVESQTTSQPTPIPKQPTIIASPESIVDRVKNRRIQAPSLITAADITSIAERVAQRRRQSASSVLDKDTGKLLEYRQLLRDPKHKEIWTKAGANEFSRLAQEEGGRIDGTNTIFCPQA